MGAPFIQAMPFDTAQIGKALVALAACAAANGCATVKSMTADFEKKWEDPQSIIAEMDAAGARGAAANASTEAMAAINANDCASRYGLLDANADPATLSTRQVSAGECLLSSGKNEEAVKMFTLAADADGGAPALQGKGVALVRLENYDAATEALQAATSIDPSLARAWNAFGVAVDNLGRPEEAEAAFVKAVELDPEDGAALNNLGVLQTKLNRREEAIASFKAALETNGAHEAAEANLRLAIALGGDYAGATRALPESARAMAYNNAGVAAASRGDKAEAKKLFARALEDSPHFYAKAYNNLSLLVE